MFYNDNFLPEILLLQAISLVLRMKKKKKNLKKNMVGYVTSKKMSLF